MCSVQVSKAKGPLEIVERDIPEPAPREVRIKVQACGICHGDSVTKEGLFPGIQYPRVPGHEVAGVIDSVGKGVTGWKIGQRVAVGWHGGHCGHCESCRRGDFITCSYLQVPGIAYDGGYADYVTAPTEAIVSIPAELSATDAAPLMCAGITTYNALRNSGARVGDVVAILGVGGLGHLGIQFGSKMGFKTIAISRGKDKEDLVRKLGATQYINSKSQNVVEELVKLGGGKAMTAVLGGLSINGKLIMIGASGESLEISPLIFISGRGQLRKLF
jgi:D-arabinose 1-dehydrogenase-like Zn-dependent alcohol dehydrogenase